MTNLALIISQPSLIAKLFRSLLDWLNEPVAADTPLQFSSRDWADLPVHHPTATPDGKDVR
jgi:hypothetical protein